MLLFFQIRQTFCWLLQNLSTSATVLHFLYKQVWVHCWVFQLDLTKFSNFLDLILFLPLNYCNLKLIFVFSFCKFLFPQHYFQAYFGSLPNRGSTLIFDLLRVLNSPEHSLLPRLDTGFTELLLAFSFLSFHSTFLFLLFCF